MLKNVADITSQGKQTGLNTQDNILGIDKSQSPNMMNVQILYDGSSQKRLGSNTQNSVIIASSAGPGFSPTGSITNNLIAYWKLDEPSGNRFDSVGGHTLIDNNSISYDAGIRNRAALFVASNSQYLLHSNTSTLATGDVDFSMSAWIYLNSTSTTLERTIISKREWTVGSLDSSTLLLLHFNGADTSTTITDSSIFGRTPTVAGNAQLDTGQEKFGSASLQCDGNGDWISYSDSSDWELGSGNYTWDGWFRINSGNRNQNIAGLRESGGNNNIFIGITSANKLRCGGEASANASFAHSISGGTTVSEDTWYHAAMVRNGDVVSLYLNGNLEISASISGNGPTGTFTMNIGNDRDLESGESWSGWIDEFRFLKGTAFWTSSFTPPTSEYLSTSNYEYWLYVGTDQVVTFRVSSSGSTEDGTVRATSFGAITTSTWYNVIAYHDTGNQIAVGVNLSMTSASYASGVRSGSAPFVIGAVSNGSASFFDGRIDETGFWKKVLTTTDRANLYNSGSGNTYATAFDNKPWASFDFGASSIRWLTVSAGTGVYASSNLGVTWVNIATDRTANYQFFERSKNVLISTSDSYDTPLAWPGSSGTFMVAVNSNAPLCKYSINFNGFLVMLNSSTRKRGFFYQDENTQLTGTWASSFDIPSSQDDEITACFVLRRYLYVSTKYYLYRVSYVGGNPDFSYLKVKDWGYIPRTVKIFYVEGVGQVVAGLCWDGKMRFFDGSDDQIFSKEVEQDNGLCDFSLEKLSFAGSGPIISFAENDDNENEYKLCVAIGKDSSQTTHILNYNGRSKSFYPYDRQHFNTMVMAESGNRRFLMAFDRSGYCHMMNSGNLDGNTSSINDYFDSSLIYEKAPSQIHKGYQTHLFFSNTSCGRIHYMDRIDFDNNFVAKDNIFISGSDNKFQIHKTIDTPETYNVYQFRITSSSGTNSPWKLQRYDCMLNGLGIGPNNQ